MSILLFETLRSWYDAASAWQTTYMSKSRLEKAYVRAKAKIDELRDELDYVLGKSADDRQAIEALEKDMSGMKKRLAKAESPKVAITVRTDVLDVIINDKKKLWNDTMTTPAMFSFLLSLVMEGVLQHGDMPVPRRWAQGPGSGEQVRAVRPARAAAYAHVPPDVHDAGADRLGLGSASRPCAGIPMIMDVMEGVLPTPGVVAKALAECRSLRVQGPCPRPRRREPDWTDFTS